MSSMTPDRAHPLFLMPTNFFSFIWLAPKRTLLLELNARPGLGVQLANQVGIEKALERIDPAAIGSKSLEKRAFGACGG